MSKYRAGQLIKIIDVDEFPEYNGKIGVITDIINGELYGTWENAQFYRILIL